MLAGAFKFRANSDICMAYYICQQAPPPHLLLPSPYGPPTVVMAGQVSVAVCSVCQLPVIAGTIGGRAACLICCCRSTVHCDMVARGMRVECVPCVQG